MIELLTATQMQQVDAAAIASGIDSYELMIHAARGVFEEIQSVLRPGQRVIVVAGPGNNGGDGAVLAQLLHQAQQDVTLLRFASADVNRGDAKRAFSEYEGPVQDLPAGISPPEIDALLEGSEFIVDAMLGAGLSRAPAGIVALLIEAINRHSAQVMSIDLPSGVDANNLDVPGAVVNADVTVTFVRYKIAHFVNPCRQHCGRLSLKQIGIDESHLPFTVESNQHGSATPVYLDHVTLWQNHLPLPDQHSHKFSRGHVIVRGGGMASTGAARLSALAALHSGAGLVSLSCPAEALAVNAAHLTAVMSIVHDEVQAWEHSLSDPRITCVLVGPGNGLAEINRRFVEAALESDRACVLDADALSGFEADTGRLFSRLQSAAAMAVLTPHTGEFARLFPSSASDGNLSRLRKAQAAAKTAGAVVVLKGADTIIASPDGMSAINTGAPPWLATAGSGDVLAGIIAAMRAQGMGAFHAACAGVWLHTSAARLHRWPMTAEQLLGSVTDAAAAVAAVPMPLLPAGLPGHDSN